MSEALDPIASQDREVLQAEIARLDEARVSVESDVRYLDVSVAELLKNRTELIATRARRRATMRTLALTGTLIVALGVGGFFFHRQRYVESERWHGRATAVEGAIPVVVGESCVVTLDSELSSFNARFDVHCGDLRLYGGGHLGYVDCDSADGHAVRCRDPWPTTSDGDPAIDYDRARSRVVVNDGQRWRVTIDVSQPPNTGPM